MRQQYQAIAPLVGELLKSIGTNEKADVTQRVVEDADAVVVLTTEGAQAMVFPTAETLPELKSLAGKSKKSGALAVVNSQIRTNNDGSNLISDLGIGPWKKKNEEFSRSSDGVLAVRTAHPGRDRAPPESYQQPWQLYVLTEMTADSEPGVRRRSTSGRRIKSWRSCSCRGGIGGGDEHHRPSEAGGAVQRDVGFVQA